MLNRIWFDYGSYAHFFNLIMILSQTKLFKTLKSNTPKVPKQAEAKRDVEPTKLQFQSILNTKIVDALKTLGNRSRQ